MADPKNKLQKKFEMRHRHANFGDCIRKITLERFRCHQHTSIEVQSPIMAFCGLNGTGKSTILHAAACAYKSDNQGFSSPQHFFAKIGDDADPTGDLARIVFEYEENDRSAKTVTLSKPSPRARRGEWNGLRRRPESPVYFAGVSECLPKVETPYYCYKARNVRVGDPVSVNATAKGWVERILQRKYEDVHHVSVAISGDRNPKIARVIVTAEDGTESIYSEVNMGFGEARTIHMVSSIESLTDKSLIILEEPETSLHPSAQYTFGEYLVDVSYRKGHQILLTTHSEFLQQALPPKSNCFLLRQGDQVVPLYGLRPSQSKSLMTNGNYTALTVLVEDDAAQAMLREIVRIEDEMFLRTLNISIGGDCDQCKKAVKALGGAKVNVVAVLDGDQAAVPTENIYKLPGTKPPEKEIYESDSFLTILNGYRVDKPTADALVAGKDHHDWLKIVANQVSITRDAFLQESARAYANSLPATERSSLVELLKEAISK